ncbi:histone deacetylase [Salinivibrio sp. ES.052]|uniref:histone deacetylase family protein n=1 Tax=Salinivibrio sp. ES.052 TaxID=1882823 RepID=UPI000927D463|nr:histone deacetylase [Salinivibrio sp. ES.052]SIN95059.1 Acetoin utilization deacetylase AcuC [Salinivibrio sp. ES.052]
MLPLIYHPVYSDFPLPEGHRYPLQKYRLLFERLQTLALPVRFHQPAPATREVIDAIHDPNYVSQLLEGHLPLVKMRRIGFPWSRALITRSLTSLGGTTLMVDHALRSGFAIHLTGGYHHAHYDFGSGFCLFNDLMIAARHALTQPGVDKVMIIDCDVHHGDGTAALAANHPDIMTFSVHCEKNFPSRKPPSDLDLPLPKGTQDQDYLDAFLPLLDLALAQHRPDMVIYDAGVDVHQDDALGYLSLSANGIYQRDVGVLSRCAYNDIPVAAVIGGGYHDDQHHLVPLHEQLIQAAINAFPATISPLEVS